MKRNVRGFTLVELLVVMAIISILAAIVVPNVINYLKRAKATRARAEIASIEGALVKMLSDSGRTSLSQLFKPDQVGQAIGIYGGQELTAQAFLNAEKIYTNVIYALLRDGRGAGTLNDIVPGSGANGSVAKRYSDLLNNNIVKRLGTSYLDIGFDPWTNLYNIYPGPWPSLNGPTPFRKYLKEGDLNTTGQTLPGRGDSADALTCDANDAGSDILVDPDTGELLTIGFPAARDKVAFIWSNGENAASGQAIYEPKNGNPLQYGDGTNSIQYYDLQANTDGLQIGGGDDVNNWDASGSWSRFY